MVWGYVEDGFNTAKNAVGDVVGGVTDAFKQNTKAPNIERDNYWLGGREGHAQEQAKEMREKSAAIGAAGANALNRSKDRMEDYRDRGMAYRDSQQALGEGAQARAMAARGRQGAQINQGAIDQFGSYARQGPGASQAQAQLDYGHFQQRAQMQDNLEQQFSQNLAMARSGRGAGGNAQAMRQAAFQNAAASQAMNRQYANSTEALNLQQGMVRAQESDAWRGRQLQAMQGQLQGATAQAALADAQLGRNDQMQMNYEQMARSDYERALKGDLGYTGMGEQAYAQGQNFYIGTKNAANQYDQTALAYDRAQQAANSQYDQARLGVFAPQVDSEQKRDAGVAGMVKDGVSSVGTLLSDVRSKKKIFELESELESKNKVLEMAGLAPKPETRAPDYQALDESYGREAQHTFRQAPGYGYEYKDKKNGDGQRFGPMAQHLERTPVGADMVKDTKKGKVVDVGKISMANAAAASMQQKDIDILNQRLEQVEREKQAEAANLRAMPTAVMPGQPPPQDPMTAELEEVARQKEEERRRMLSAPTAVMPQVDYGYGAV